MVNRPNCKLCASARRAEAEARFATSGDRKAVHRWLEDQGERLSYNAVKNHFARHVATGAEPMRPPEVIPPAGTPDGLAILAEMQALTLRQVRQLAAVRTDERNIGPISAALFRGADLLGRQVDLRAKLLGYYNPVDETTWLQFEAMLGRLRAILSGATPEQRQILASVIEDLEELGQHAEQE